jgi:hypothetical protein
MHEIIVCPYGRDSHVHDYRPVTLSETYAVARELARDFPYATVLAYQVLNGRRFLIERYENGRRAN